MLTAGVGESAVIDITNSNALPDGFLYAQVTVESVNSTTVSFSVDPLTTYLTPGTNFGLQSFGFNTDLINPVSSGPPAGRTSEIIFSISGPAGWSFDYNGNQDGYGNFEFDYSGTGSARKDPLNFTIQYLPSGSAVPISPDNFIVTNANGWNFAMHIAGFTNYGQTTSAFFADGTTTPVPEPGTMLLLGSGLIGLAGWGRKKFRK